MTGRTRPDHQFSGVLWMTGRVGFSLQIEKWAGNINFLHLSNSGHRTKCYTGPMNEQSNRGNHSQAIFILAGTTGEYTAARQRLKLTPPQAHWLTGASRLNGVSSPKVYRVGSWRTLARLKAIEAALVEVKAEIIDLQEER